MTKPTAFFAACFFTALSAFSQEPLPKVSHVEPLYMDLVRDLGARKGEKEWNVGLSLEDKTHYHSLGGLVEYEFAPANRLGVEVEVPFSVHFRTDRQSPAELPVAGINGIKVATQYTFFVSPALNLSLAAGYANDLEFHMEKEKSVWRLHPENVLQPFGVVAKSWFEGRFHTLLYVSPALGVGLRTGHLQKELLLNADFHYRFPKSRNVLGVEINQTYGFPQVGVVLRPQVKVNLTKGVALGVVTGIPVLGKAEGPSLFCRLIYEPPGRSRK